MGRTMILFVATQTLGEKLAIGTEVALMGIAIVFFVLAILWGCLEIFRIIFYEIPKKKEEQRKAEPASTPAVVQTEVEETVSESEAEQDEGEVLAAITAAIALMTEKRPGTFRVVSFRRSEKRIGR